ncbi:MAG: response regulator [Isosphaera sp.]|nr:response regulator [Isosphaera sp.]
MHRPLRILVVDDHPDAAEATAELLALCGHDTRHAHTRAAAVRVATDGFVPDVVVTDLRLPDGDGCGLAVELAMLLTPRPALVAVTGLMGQEGRCRAAGFDHYFLKPADPAALAAVMAGYAQALRPPPPGAAP